MDDLGALLERAAGLPSAPVDWRKDLSRGRMALSRARRRRGALGLAVATVVGVACLGPWRATSPSVVEDTAARPSTNPEVLRVELLSQPFQAGPYTIGTTPQGWEVQGSNASSVTMAPIGYLDRNPDAFAGKLAILFDRNPQSGTKVFHNGRAFVLAKHGGYLNISTATRADEPRGVIRVQYPSHSGWTRQAIVEFLDSVHVGSGAQPGLG